MPPDVLAYSGSKAARGADKVAQVKVNVSRIMGMIEAEKKAEIQRKEMEHRIKLEVRLLGFFWVSIAHIL